MPYTRIFNSGTNRNTIPTLFHMSYSRASVRQPVAGKGWFLAHVMVETQMELKTLQTIEKEHLQTVLEKTDWDLEKTSQLLRIHVSQVKRKIRLYDLRKNDQE